MKVKRPLFIFVFSIFVVIYAINTMPKSVVYASLALFALLIPVHRFTKNRHTAALLIAAAGILCGIVYFNCYKSAVYEKIHSISGIENTVLEGVVTAEGHTSAAKYYTVKADRINGRSYGCFSVTVYTGKYLKPGDNVVMTGKFKAFTPKSNYLYNYGKGVFGYFYEDSITVLPESRNILSFFANIRTKLTDRASFVFSYDTAGVAKAMGLGDKSSLSDKAVNAFNFTGISHILVVSGLHVGFVVMVFNKLVYLLPVHKKIKNILVSFMIFMFMGIIGFTPSIIRAGVLIIAMLTGRNLFLETDNYTILALVVLITLIINPYSAQNASLLLSYSAYFGVIYAAELSRNKGWKNLYSSLRMTTFAVFYTAPVMAVLGMNTTLLSPVFNLLLSPLVMIICVFSFFLPVIYYIPFIGSIVCTVAAPAADIMIRMLLSFTEFVSENMAFAVVNMGQEHIKAIVFAALAAVFIAVVQADNKYVRYGIIFVVPVMAFMCYNYKNSDTVTVRVFDGSSEPSYILSTENADYLVMSENINEKRFRSIMESENIDRFETVVYCPEKNEQCMYIGEYTDNIVTISESGRYSTDAFILNSKMEKRSMEYILDVSGVTFVFNHKRTDLSGTDADFYFFGSDTPSDFSAEQCFYFYPVIKSNARMAQDKQATELYGILTIKINKSTGDYFIVKDVKNFGSQL